jgi:NitT/TauT family transport system substrate-binding protein
MTDTRLSLSRRNLLALGGAGLAATMFANPLRAQELTPLTVQLNWLETGDFAAIFAAEMKGFDAARGIKQSFIPGGPQIDPVQSVAGGAAPIGIAASVGQLALARAAGIPVKMLGAFFRQAPTGLISLADNPIRTPQDAVGKRIGLQGGARSPWSIILAANGIKESDMTIVPVAGDVTPLVSKQVDGYWGTAVNQHLALKAQGIDNQIMTRGDAGAPEHFEVVFALERTIKRQGDEISRWLAAVIEGQRFTQQHPEEVGAYIAERSPDLQLKPEGQKAQVTAALAFIPATGKDLPLLRIDEENATLAVEQLTAQGMLQSAVSVADLLDTETLDNAYALIG